MATQAEIFSVTQWLIARYPNSNWPEATIKAWMEDLADCPANELQAAAIAWYNAPHDWPPNAGQLRALALDLAAGPESDWENAWNAIWQHARECRAPEHLCRHDLAALLGDEGYVALQAVGGWYLLMRSDVSDHPTIRAQFRDVYRTRATRARAALRLPAAVTTLLEAARPAQQIASAPAIALDDAPAQPDGLRPAPRDWQRQQGARHADFDEVVRQIAARRATGQNDGHLPRA